MSEQAERKRIVNRGRATTTTTGELNEFFHLFTSSQNSCRSTAHDWMFLSA